MKSAYELLLVFVLSLAAGIVIFLPGMIPSGDASQFATFVRQIKVGNGIIPAYNTYYYPGSEYIYPPVLFYLSYLISLPFVIGTTTYFYEYSLMSIAIFVTSLTAVLMYYTGFPYHNKVQTGIAVVLTCLMGADLYALPWGGYAYIFAQFFLIALIFVISNSRKESPNHANLTLYTVLLTVIISFSHDLTWALLVYLMITVAIFFRIKKEYFTSRLAMISAATGVVAGGIWWVPRLSFLFNAVFLSYSSGVGEFQSIHHPLALVLSMIPSIVTLGVVIAIIGISAIYSTRKIDLKDPFLVSSLLLVPFGIFIIWDQVVTARVMLYIFPLLTVFTLRNLPELSDLRLNFKKFFRKLRGKHIVSLVFAGILIAGPVQVFLDQNASHFYSTGSFQYDQNLVNYASNSSHFGNYTVLAPYVGQYLSSIDGTRVIMYEGIVYGNTQINERNAAIGILEMPNSTSSQLNITNYNLGYVIIPTSWVNSTVDGVSINLGMFSIVYADNYYTVYQTNLVA